MNRFLFILNVIAMVVLTRPLRWEWEYKQIKQEYKDKEKKSKLKQYK